MAEISMVRSSARPGSFGPEDGTYVLRSYIRQRDTLTKCATAEEGNPRQRMSTEQMRRRYFRRRFPAYWLVSWLREGAR